MSFYIKIHEEKPFYRIGDKINGELQFTVGKRLSACVNISLFLMGTEIIEWTEKRHVEVDKEVMEDPHADQRKFLHTKAQQMWNILPPHDKSMQTPDQIYTGLLTRDGIPFEVRLEKRIRRVRELQSFPMHKRVPIMEKKTIVWASRQGQEDVDPGYFAWPFEFFIDTYGPSSYHYKGNEGTAVVQYVLHAYLQQGEKGFLDNIGDSILNFFTPPPEHIALTKEFVLKSSPISQRDYESDERNTKQLHTHEKTLFLRGGVINFTVAIAKNTFKTTEDMSFEVVMFHNTGASIANFDMILHQHNAWKDGTKPIVKFDKVIATQKFTISVQKDTRFYQVFKYKVPVVPESSLNVNRTIQISYSVDFVFPLGFEYPMIKFPIDVLDIDGCAFHPNEKVYQVISLDHLHVWKPDHLVNECMQCKAKFSLFNRKHHCRVCGGIFCGTCSTRKLVTLGSGDPKRVCDACFQGQKNALNQPTSPQVTQPIQQPIQVENIEGHDILIVSALNGFVFSIVDALNPVNSALCMMKKNGTEQQIWKFKDGNLINVKTGLVLGIRDTKGSDLSLQTPTGEIYQKWSFQDGFWINSANGLVLDIAQENKNEGAALCLYQKNDNAQNQKWSCEVVKLESSNQFSGQIEAPQLDQPIHVETHVHNPVDHINMQINIPSSAPQYTHEVQQTIPIYPEESQTRIPVGVESHGGNHFSGSIQVHHETIDQSFGGNQFSGNVEIHQESHGGNQFSGDIAPTAPIMHDVQYSGQVNVEQSNGGNQFGGQISSEPQDVHVQFQAPTDQYSGVVSQEINISHDTTNQFSGSIEIGNPNGENYHN